MFSQNEKSESVKKILNNAGVVYAAEFVPLSKARREDGDAEQSINWLVSLTHGSTALRVPFRQGIGHLPNFGHSLARLTVDDSAIITKACEQGKGLRRDWRTVGSPYLAFGPKLPPPDVADVMYCLLSDAEAIDYPSYEEWAADLGFDADSRKGERAYRECLATGLALRRLFGETALAELREALAEW